MALPPLHLQNNNTGSTSKRLLKHRTHMLFYNILTIPKLQRSDRGLYTCRVTSGQNAKQQKVDVTVYGAWLPLKFLETYWLKPQEQMYFLYWSIFTDWITAGRSGWMSQQQSLNFTKICACVSIISDRPFIRLKPRRGSVMEAQAGQKSYRISPKLRAFPPPKVIW